GEWLGELQARTANRKVDHIHFSIAEGGRKGGHDEESRDGPEICRHFFPRQTSVEKSSITSRSGGSSEFARRLPQGLKLPPERVQVDPGLVAHAEPVDRAAQALLFTGDADAGLEARGRSPDAPGNCPQHLDRSALGVDLESEGTHGPDA